MKFSRVLFATTIFPAIFAIFWIQPTNAAAFQEVEAKEKQDENVADDSKVTPTGSWTWERDSPNGKLNPVLKLAEKDGKVSGSYKDQENEYEIKEGTFKDGKIDMTMTVDFQGQEMKINFVGEVSGEKIDGIVNVNLDGETREFPWNPKRVAAESSIEGQWELSFTTPGGEMNPTIEVSKGDDEGDYVVGFIDGLEGDVDNVVFQDSKLSFEIETVYEEQELFVAYDLDVDGDELNGILTFEFVENGQSGELEVLGERKK